MTEVCYSKTLLRNTLLHEKYFSTKIESIKIPFNIRIFKNFFSRASIKHRKNTLKFLKIIVLKIEPPVINSFKVLKFSICVVQ